MGTLAGGLKVGANNKFFRVIITGDRGSGKTKLMKWIEQNHPDVVAILPKEEYYETEIHTIVMKKEED